MGRIVPWTEEEIERLKSLITTHTYSELMPHFPGRERNALIGKAHRLGLAGLRTPADDVAQLRAGKGRPKPSKPRAMKLMGIPLGDPAPAGTVLSHGIVGTPVAMPEPPAWVPTEEEPEPEPVVETDPRPTLLDLREHHCRWPINDGNPFRFCGSTKQLGKSYCAHHVSMAVQKSKIGTRQWVPPKVSAYKFRAS